MRLFRLGLWIVVVAIGCKREEVLTAGALRVDLSYATFRPGCLTLTATDKADPARTETQRVDLGSRPERSRQLTVAVFREAGWSRNLVLTATAYERACDAQDRRQVATQTVEAEVPVEGTRPVSMALRAEDLDDDGYVKESQGGTDCEDDDEDVNPGEVEECNGRDDNCSGGEADAQGAITYYADRDGDGFGDPNRTQRTCIQPLGTVTNSLDCNDDSDTVNPDQRELRCDGQDDNCNQATDETFNVDAGCTTTLGCMGTVACTGVTASACVSSQPLLSWYVDEDGDLRAGTDAGPGCQAPVPGAVTRRDDCDESSPFAFDGGVEQCDLLDNDCNGQVDELNCGAVAWQPIPDAGTPSTEYRAVAAYAQGKAWVAGLNGALAHIEGSVATRYSDCPGSWVSAWARGDGRVFLGSTQGEIATREVAGAGCLTTNTGKSASINGLMGFESGATTTLFAVASDGRIYRWVHPGAATPTELSRVGANLRDVHGTSAANLLAVGVEQVGSVLEPRAFRSNPDGGPAWLPERLPTPLPTGVYLRGVHMVHGQLAYAAGDKGVLYERSRGTWSVAPPLLVGGDTPNIQDVVAYGRSVVYAAASDEAVYRFTGTSWEPVYTGTWTPFAIDGVGPDDVWVAGDQGQVIHRAP
jgi:hypothetical protein